MRELKVKLSSYLARAAAGEIVTVTVTVTVTDGGRPLARLAPPPGAVDVLAATGRVQQLVPDAVLVEGTGSSAQGPAESA